MSTTFTSNNDILYFVQIASLKKFCFNMARADDIIFMITIGAINGLYFKIKNMFLLTNKLQK